jgi:hypothetical protein
VEGKSLSSGSGMKQSIEQELTRWPVSRMSGRSVQRSSQLNSQIRLRLSIVGQVVPQGKQVL